MNKEMNLRLKFLTSREGQSGHERGRLRAAVEAKFVSQQQKLPVERREIGDCRV